MTNLHLLLWIVATVTAEEFVATDDWQEIKPGQKVPSGLHYRMNLETGKKEAKILAAADSPESDLVAVGDPEPEIEPITADSAQKVKEKVGKLKVTKDIEEIKYLMANFHNASEPNKLVILQDLDYYMHQIDNAKDFVSLKGFERIVIPTLREPNANNLSSVATMLIGSAVQSNPPVQEYAIGIGLIDDLINNLAVDHEELKAKTVFALSTLLRNNSQGLNLFLESNGLKQLNDGVKNTTVRLKLKALSFVIGLDTELDPSWCQAVKDEQLYSDMPDLGRIEVLSDILKFFIRKQCEFQQKTFGWSKMALEVVNSELEDEDDKDFIEYLNHLKENLIFVLHFDRKTEL